MKTKRKASSDKEKLANQSKKLSNGNVWFIRKIKGKIKKGINEIKSLSFRKKERMIPKITAVKSRYPIARI